MVVWVGKAAQTMYTHISKCKNDIRKKVKGRDLVMGRLSWIIWVDPM
jgi:hypothetical protein